MCSTQAPQFPHRDLTWKYWEKLKQTNKEEKKVNDRAGQLMETEIQNQVDEILLMSIILFFLPSLKYSFNDHV